MKQTTSQWLQAQRCLARQEPRQPRQGLRVDGRLVGSVEAHFARQLGAELLAAHGVDLDWRDGRWVLLGSGSASQNLNRLAQAMRVAGVAGAWRNEQLAVCDENGLAVATIERGAVRPLGIATRAVHLVGTAANGCVWAQQRADDKATNPGMWDTLMGGMISAADTLEQALERETWEEAGLRVRDLAALGYGGHVEFARPCGEAEGQGYMRERIDWFSALVPEPLRPDNQDGEVQRFELLDLPTLEDWLVQGRFTPEASLILAAYLRW
ncbi:NUDIX hydrolase [Comamonas guangdongensis]|uniref:NUDIX domain-containing protein n=1 Tax=Comamonas guangdongensis TaxID=510515 RepID=A0ABV3ZR29_9BURK